LFIKTIQVLAITALVTVFAMMPVLYVKILIMIPNDSIIIDAQKYIIKCKEQIH